MDLTGPELHPVYFLQLFDSRDPSWIDLEPGGLREFVRGFGQTSRVNWHKIQGVKTLRKIASPFEDWRIFEKVVQALNGDSPTFGVVDPTSITEMVGGAHIMMIATRDLKRKFTEEIMRYAAAVARSEGCGRLPDPLGGANRYLDTGTLDDYRNAEGYKKDLDYALMEQLEAMS